MVRRVVFRIATRSQSRSASSRRWVVRKIVTPLRLSVVINWWTSRVATGSRPAVGSSRNSTSGSLSSALARATGWVGHLVEIGETPEVLGHGQTQVQARRLRHDRDPPADLDTIVRGQRGATDDRSACRRGQQGPKRPHHRGLAGAVGAEKPEHLTVSHLEGDVVEGDAVAEPLRQTLDQERWSAAVTSRRRPAVPVAHHAVILQGRRLGAWRRPDILPRPTPLAPGGDPTGARRRAGGRYVEDEGEGRKFD